MTKIAKIKKLALKRRHQRVRVKIKGTKTRPRISVFRSNKHIYAQLIDDEKGQTLISASDFEIKKPATTESQKNSEIQRLQASESQGLQGKAAVAHEVGQLLAAKALKQKIHQVVFDRGGYKYHGRIKALADGARAGGLKF